MEVEVLQEKLAEWHRRTGSGHWASSRSVLPILVDIRRRMVEGDVCILSKAHGVSAYRLVFGGGLPEGPLVQDEFGSLGAGLGVAVGRAFARRLRGDRGLVYVVMGDGEWQEGSCWESLKLACRLGLDNIRVYVDCNGMQGMGDVAAFDVRWTGARGENYVFLERTVKGLDWTCHYKGP